MRWMMVLVMAVMGMPSAAADGGDDEEDSRAHQIMVEVLESVPPEAHDVVREAATCVGMSRELKDDYIDREYYPGVGDGNVAGPEWYVSIRTNPSGTDSKGAVLVVGANMSCQSYFHEGDAAFVVG